MQENSEISIEDIKKRINNIEEVYCFEKQEEMFEELEEKLLSRNNYYKRNFFDSRTIREITNENNSPLERAYFTKVVADTLYDPITKNEKTTFYEIENIIDFQRSELFSLRNLTLDESEVINKGAIEILKSAMLYVKTYLEDESNRKEAVKSIFDSSIFKILDNNSLQLKSDTYMILNETVEILFNQIYKTLSYGPTKEKKLKSLLPRVKDKAELRNKFIYSIYQSILYTTITKVLSTHNMKTKGKNQLKKLNDSLKILSNSRLVPKACINASKITNWIDFISLRIDNSLSLIPKILSSYIDLNNFQEDNLRSLLQIKPETYKNLKETFTLV